MKIIEKTKTQLLEKRPFDHHQLGKVENLQIKSELSRGIEEKGRKAHFLLTKIDHYLLMGIGLGVLFWVLEAIIHAYIFFHGNLINELFTPTVHEIWMRSVVIILFIIFALYAKLIIIKRKGAELALWESEEKFRLLAETIEDVFWLSTPDLVR